MFKIGELNRIYLGVQGENGARTIEIDVSEWLNTYPNGTVTIWSRRNGDNMNYTPTGIVFDSVHKVIKWTPTAVDTFYAGHGMCGVELNEGTVVKKSKDLDTFVTASAADIPTADGNQYDYNRSINKPQINGNTLMGNMDFRDLDMFDDENMTSREKAVSAGKAAEELAKKADKDGEEISSKIPKTDIVNNLTTTVEGKVLDARQGKALNDGKLDKADVIANFAQTDEGKALDATKGRELYLNKINKPSGVGAGKFLQTDQNGDPYWGGSASPQEIAQAIDEWMTENVPSGTTIAIDRSLQASNAAAPADLVGDLKSALCHSGIDIKNTLRWEVGGINNDTGGNYDAQRNRIRTKDINHADKDILICRGENIDIVEEYRVYYFDSQGTLTSKTDYISSPGEHTIEKGSYYRILLVNNSYTSDITDVYSSPIYYGINIIDKEWKEIYYILYNKKQACTPWLNDTLDVKRQIEWEVGGINNDSGHDYNAQKNRIRTKYINHTERDIVVCKGDEVGSGTLSFKVFYWNGFGQYWNTNRTSVSDWIIAAANNEYTIPANSYFRIVVQLSTQISDITDAYESLIYKGINIVGTEAKLLNEIKNNGKGFTITQLNAEMETFVQSIKSSYRTNELPNDAHSSLSILHFSDIHQRSDLWERIMDYADEKKNYLDLVLHTGDYVNNSQQTYTDLYNVKKPKSLVVYNCVGNHDTYANSSQEVTNPDKSIAKNLLFNHIDDWGVTFQDNIQNSMTYYKDFADANIRLIVLDNYYDIQSQCAWLADLLDDAKTNGMAVITASHEITSQRPSDEDIETAFQSYRSRPWAGATPTAFDEVIGEAIDNGCEHIIHLCGHMHNDWFFRSANGVLNCAVDCATAWEGWSEGRRIKNTKSFDCFNIISANVDFGIIKIVRIGKNVDNYNRRKDLLTYDYKNRQLIFSSF